MKAIWIGLVLLLIGGFTNFNFINGNLAKWFDNAFLIFFIGNFILIIGAIIIGAYFKAWLERSTGTRV